MRIPTHSLTMRRWKSAAHARFTCAARCRIACWAKRAGLIRMAIAEVREEIRPDIRDEHEFHDLLCALVIVPVEVTNAPHARDWGLFFSRLEHSGRAAIVSVDDADNHREYMVAAERVDYLRMIWPHLQLAREMPAQASAAISEQEILRRAVQGWLGILGPATSAELASALGLDAAQVFQAMLQLEMAGTALRGVFEYPPEGGQLSAAEIPNEHVQWCERRLLQRIHKRTLHALRKQIEPVAPAIYMRWVLRWQHLTPQSQLSGEQGVLEASAVLRDLRRRRWSGSGRCCRSEWRITIRAGWMRCA